MASALANVRSSSREIQRLQTLGLPGTGIPIEVRLIRRWTPYLRPDDRCYLLLDVEGHAIQAVAKGQRDIRHVERKVELLSCYRIDGYVCTEIDTYINVIKHPIHLLIGTAAVISRIPETESFPFHYFEPRVYGELQELYDKKEHLIDYIGVLEKKEFRGTNTPDPMLQLTISNSSGRTIEAALWKEVNQSPGKVNMHDLNNVHGPTLIALSSVKINNDRGRLQLQSTSATYLYVNPTSPIIDSLLDSMKAKEEQLQSERIGGALIATSSNNKISIAELQQMQKDALTARTFIVEGSVIEIHSKSGWYYNACPTCPKAANQSGAEWPCASHGRFPTPRPAYRMSATIEDGTGAIKATFFDEGVEALIGKTCSELVMDSGYTEQSIIPDPLQEAKGKTMAFHMELQRDARPGRLNMSVCNVTEVQTLLPLPIEAAPANSSTTAPLQLQAEEAAPSQDRSSSINPVTPLKIKSEPRANEKDGPKRSLKAEKGMESDLLDRLTNLPLALRFKVLSLMPTQSAVRTCVLATEWRNSWKYIQRVNFDDEEPLRHPFQVSSFIENVMEALKTTTLEAFHIAAGPLFDPLSPWIHQAICHHVTEIDLTVYSLGLPESFFISGTLSKFRLRTGVWYPLDPELIISLPNLISFDSSANRLLIANVYRVIKGSPRLESVQFSRCDEIPNDLALPKSSSVKRLELVDCFGCHATSLALIFEVLDSFPFLVRLCVEQLYTFSWHERFLPPICMVKSLNTLKIRVYSGLDNPDFQLVRYVLMNAQVLKKVELRCASGLPPEDVILVREDLDSCKRVSEECEVHLLTDEGFEVS